MDQQTELLEDIRVLLESKKLKLVEEERKWKRMLARNRKSVSSSSHSGTYCRNKGVNIRGDI